MGGQMGLGMGRGQEQGGLEGSWMDDEFFQHPWSVGLRAGCGSSGRWAVGAARVCDLQQLKDVQRGKFPGKIWWGSSSGRGAASERHKKQSGAWGAGGSSAAAAGQFACLSCHDKRPIQAVKFE